MDKERIMSQEMVQIGAGVLALLCVVVIIMRRKSSKKKTEADDF